jgi:hypothetical protein
MGMSASLRPHLDLSPHSQDIAERVLNWIHYFSPPVLFAFFLIAFVIRSVSAASPSNLNFNDQNGHQQLYGPGGKPLPQRRLTGLKRKLDKENDFPPARKLAFQAFSIVLTLTFAMSATVIILHILATERSYWCGEGVVVRKLQNLESRMDEWPSDIPSRFIPLVPFSSILSSACLWWTPNLLQLLLSYGHG